MRYWAVTEPARLELINNREKVYVVPGAKIGYAKQNMSQIDLDRTVLENVRRVSIQSESLSRIVLARLLLSERDMNKKAGELSGPLRDRFGIIHRLEFYTFEELSKVVKRTADILNIKITRG